MRENGKTWYRICKMLCEYKKYFPGIICCLLGSSFITFIHPLLIRQITDCGILQKNMKYILLFSVILIIISLTQQELNIIQTKLFSNVHNQFTHSLYKKTYWKINRMKIQYFAERGSAEIINTIGMDIDNVSSVVDQITQFSISSILQIIGGVVGLSLLDWKLAILIEAIIPLKFIIVSYCANKKREVFEQWIEDKRKFMSWFAECINGIHEMKLWNLFQVKKSQFEGLQKDLMDSYKKNAMLDEYSTVSVVVIDTVVNALLYILSGLFIIKGEFTIGGAFAFITYSAYVVNPISALINIKYYFAQIEPSAKRLFELWGQPEELEMKLCEMKPEKIYQDRDMVFEVKNLVFGYEPGHPILNGISLCVKKGERIAIVGENGSGKTTLMNMLSGIYKPDSGTILVNGRQAVINSPEDAKRLGIGMVHQHFKLVECFSVLDNIILGVEPNKMGFLQKAEARKKVMALSEKYGLRVDPDALISDISVGMQQRVEILKMLYRDNEILIFDEPTAVLTPQEIDELMEIMRGFKKEGKSILFITHKLNEIMAVADRCTVLRKGKYMGTVDIKDTTKEELSRMMVGRDVQLQVDKKPANPGEVVLDVENVTMHSAQHKKDAVRNVSFQVHAGEIVCLAGIEGNGQTEFVYGLTGLEKISSGKITLDGKDITNESIRQRSKDGMSHIPEDRHKHGLVLDYSLENNMVLQRYWQPEFQKGGFIRSDKVREYSDKLIAQYDVRSGQGSLTTVRSMSGGNQQKAIIAREIDKDPKLLVAVQPTRGLDVGAIEYIHRQIVAERDKGTAVLLVSLELDEVMNLSDRILVMYEGEVVGEFDPKTTTVQELGLYMAGARKQGKESK